MNLKDSALKDNFAKDIKEFKSCQMYTLSSRKLESICG